MKVILLLLSMLLLLLLLLQFHLGFRIGRLKDPVESHAQRSIAKIEPKPGQIHGPSHTKKITREEYLKDKITPAQCSRRGNNRGSFFVRQALSSRPPCFS